MLEQLKVNDFQGLEELTVDFDPGVTTLVGPSDSCKSATVRALMWLCFNQPDGIAFIRHGCERARVKLTVDGHRITRTRGKGENSYHWNKHRYEALGRGGVPEEVSKLLNTSSLNFQKQHDAHFWLSLTAGQVSQELNQVVNLDLIDRTLASVAAQLRRSKQEADIAQERFRSAQERGKALDWVPGAARAYRAVEESLESLEGKRARLRQVTELLQEGTRLRSEQDRVTAGLVAARKAVSAAESLLAKQDRLTRVKNLYNEVIQNQQEIAQVTKELEQAERELAQVKVCPVCGGKL